MISGLSRRRVPPDRRDFEDRPDQTTKPGDGQGHVLRAKFQGTSTAATASAIGLSQPVVHFHFRSEEHPFEEMRSLGFQGLRSADSTNGADLKAFRTDLG